VQASLGLFTAGFGGQLTSNRRLSGQFRMGPDQLQLFFLGGTGDHAMQGLLERRQIGERCQSDRACGNPG
jgi:hypothetical protein